MHIQHTYVRQSLTPVFLRRRLRDEVRAKQREAERLEGEVGTLTGALSTKSRALAAAAAASEQLKQRALKAEGARAGRCAGAAVLCGAKLVFGHQCAVRNSHWSLHSPRGVGEGLPEGLHGACGGAADLAARCAELADMEAERNRCRSEAAAAGRAADRATAQLAAIPKVFSFFKIYLASLTCYMHQAQGGRAYGML
jgi:hypothetical protein